MVSKKKWLLYARQSEIVKAVAHPVRMAILDFLKDGEQCVCDIAEHVQSERSNVSKHLSVMVSAGVLESRKEGLKVIYKLKTPCVLDFFSCIARVIEQQVRESQQLLEAI